MRGVIGVVVECASMVGVVALVVLALWLMCREERRRRVEAGMACPCKSKACPGRAVVVLPRGR